MSPRDRNSGTSAPPGPQPRRPAGALPSRSVQTITIAMQPVQPVPVTLTVVQGPPALITRRNADHLGLSSAEFLETLRRMRRDKRFGASVIVSGKLRAASPDAIVAYLRSVPVPAADIEADAEDAGVAKIYEELGLEAVPEAPAPRRLRGGSRTSRSG